MKNVGGQLVGLARRLTKPGGGHAIMYVIEKTSSSKVS